MRGEVWWYEDLSIPRRPVLILARASMAGTLTHVVGVPATTVVRRVPTEVTLTRLDGLPRECVLTLDNIGQFRAALCTELITTLPTERMTEVCAALAVATDC
ncbi:MAG: type II toxin-antitoxin system PemK/MazF family toxin [Euzebya sp.]